MIVYCLYKNPTDYPDRYVLRRWVIFGCFEIPEREPLIVDTDLDKVRRKIPVGHARKEKLISADPVVFEVWFPELKNSKQWWG